jgi:uncharacterized repeat protein (TIGR04138 family)
MQKIDDAIEQLVKTKTKYPREAYDFVREALDFTIRKQKKGCRGQDRHITGQQLLEGARDYALDQFGPMSRTVLSEWNLQCCEDIGEVVYNMVEVQILGTTPADSKDDFKNGYDFDEAFSRPFDPPTPLLHNLTSRSGPAA